MTQNIPHKAHRLTKTSHLPKDPEERTKVMLREIAFVLKLTEKVRKSIEADEAIREPVLA